MVPEALPPFASAIPELPTLPTTAQIGRILSPEMILGPRLSGRHRRPNRG